MDSQPGERAALLVPQSARVARRRRTADEAELEPFEYTPIPKLGRKDAKKGKRKESGHRPVQHQRSVIDGDTPSAVTMGQSGANDWPMTEKEKYSPNRTVPAGDGHDETNLMFPLVFDISHAMAEDTEDLAMECNEIDEKEKKYGEMGEYGGRGDSRCPAVITGIGRKRNRRSGTSTVSTAMSAMSHLSVSEYDHGNKTRKRPIYLLIIFASFDTNQQFKCDAYVTCVNHLPNGIGRATFGVNWTVTKLMELFIRQAATNRMFNGNRRWLMACCLVEALACSPLVLNVNAYWRHVSHRVLTAPIEALRRIGPKPGRLDRACPVDTIFALNATSQLTLVNGDLALVSTIARAACWLIQEYKRLQVLSTRM